VSRNYVPATAKSSVKHEPRNSDVQGPAPSRQALAAEPQKPEPGRALLDGLVGLRARLAVDEAVNRALKPRLSGVSAMELRSLICALIEKMLGGPEVLCSVFPCHNGVT
jgi:hypothetical protein